MLSHSAARPIIDTVPDRYREAEDKRPDLVGAVQNGRWVVVAGPTGRGKSYTMASIAREFGSCGWLDWPEFLSDIRAHWKLDTPDAARFDPMAWATAYNPPLFVDDVGAEDDALGAEKFALLVNRRYNGQRALVITTNLSVGDLQARYGARTVSRLTEMAEWITLTGPDLRLSKAATP